jgi:hypothetical protein
MPVTNNPRLGKMPSFRPVWLEDSLFLPRCGHAAGSHFALGTGKWGDCHMKIKASGRSALILATGLLVCFAAPLPANAASTDSATSASKADTASSANATKQNSRHSKRDAHRKSAKAAEKSPQANSDSKTAADTGAADAGGGLPPAAIPPAVANANAQLTADASPDNASAMSAKANTLLAAADKPADAQPATDDQVVSSDQLNDVDRVLQQGAPTTQNAQATQGAPATQANPSSTQTVAMAPVRAASASPMLASNESTTWDQTSLIGKIFIGFGALLTMASAARMFMA